jgi:ectoine hydroxylase-related dioxygenase (phytanoyl-CoA dioxygenase family)
LHALPSEQAGVRIHGIEALRPILAAEGAVGGLAAQFLGKQCRAVRAILFDKTANTNWSLAWHQDRTICVKRRIDVEGYGPWTMKSGLQHVAPPFDLLSRMLTLRVHLDDVPAENSPLLIAPGSHLAGRVPIEQYGDVVAHCGSYACLAEAGDVWVYATPILHASDAACVTGHRRVLQIDYSADELTGGLEWLGV